MTLYIHHLTTKAWTSPEGGGRVHRYLLTADPEGKKIATTFVHSENRCQENLHTVDIWARAMNVKIANREQYSLGKEGADG